MRSRPQASSLAREPPRLCLRWDDGHSTVFGPTARSQGTRCFWWPRRGRTPRISCRSRTARSVQGGQRASGRVRPSSGRAAGRWSAPPAVDPSWLVAHDRPLVTSGHVIRLGANALTGPSRRYCARRVGAGDDRAVLLVGEARQQARTGRGVMPSSTKGERHGAHQSRCRCNR